MEATRKLFTVGIMINGDLFASGTGFNKKEAGQVAAQKALEKINKNGSMA
jgi:ribonuclease-3